jgi:hypothetical protein
MKIEHILGELVSLANRGGASRSRTSTPRAKKWECQTNTR